MNLMQRACLTMAAAVLAGGVLGPSAASTFADSAGLQPTQILFTSTSSTLDRAKAFTTPGSPVVAFSGLVSPNATGTVKMFDTVWDGTTVQTGLIDTEQTCPSGVKGCPTGAFAVVIPTTSLSTGVHLLTAVYLGDGHFAPSCSPVFTGPGY